MSFAALQRFRRFRASLACRMQTSPHLANVILPHCCNLPQPVGVTKIKIGYGPEG